MKSDGFKRSVRAKAQERTAGDAPNMGKVTRMPGTGLPKILRRKRKSAEGNSRGNRLRRNRRRAAMSWSIFLGAVTLALLGVFIWFWIHPIVNTNDVISSTATPSVVLPSKVPSRFPSPTETEALALVEHALALRDPARVGDYFRPTTASPDEVVRFLKDLELRDGVFEHCEWLSSMDSNGLSLDGVLVHFKGVDKPRNRIAMLTPDAAGVWKIDFDAFARMVTPAWSELLEKSAQVAQVRVYSARDSYYNGPFKDDDLWICHGLASPDTDEILTAYCKVGSPQAAAMKWIYSTKSKMSRMVLEIRRVAGAESKQFEITRVLADDWVMGGAPFDEGFK